MKGKIYRVLFAFLIFGLVGSLTTAFGQATRETGRKFFDYNLDGMKPVTLIFASTARINTAGDIESKFFKQLVETESQGKIKIDLHEHSSLYKMTDIPKVLPKGTIDIGAINKGLLMTREPGYGPWVVAYVWKNPEHLLSVTSSREWYEMEDSLAKKKWNMKPLNHSAHGNWDYWSSQPIKTMDDFRGKRVWSYGQLSNAYIKAWGGTPIIKSTSEMYMAYRKGDLHAISFSVVGYHDYKFYEGGKYWLHMPTYPPGSIGFHYVQNYMNRTKWNKLSETQKRIVLDASDLMSWHGIWEGFCQEAAWEFRLTNEKGVIDVGISTKTPEEYKKITAAAVAAGKEYAFARGVKQAQWDEAKSLLAKYARDEYTSKYSWWYELANAESKRRMDVAKNDIAAGKSADEAYGAVNSLRERKMSYEEQKAYWISIPRIARDWPMELRLQ